MDINYDVITFLSKYLYFKKAWGSHFADITKVETFFIKTIFVDSRKVKRILYQKEFCIKMHSVRVFLYIAKFADFR